MKLVNSMIIIRHELPKFRFLESLSGYESLSPDHAGGSRWRCPHRINEKIRPIIDVAVFDHLKKSILLRCRNRPLQCFGESEKAFAPLNF
jgi:hypothetical protein